MKDSTQFYLSVCGIYESGKVVYHNSIATRTDMALNILNINTGFILSVKLFLVPEQALLIN